LAAAPGKSVEQILLLVCRQASKQREVAETALKTGVSKLELALVQCGTVLTNEVSRQGAWPVNEIARALRSGTGRPALTQYRATG
jgi:hypothetical protein